MAELIALQPRRKQRNGCTEDVPGKVRNENGHISFIRRGWACATITGFAKVCFEAPFSGDCIMRLLYGTRESASHAIEPQEDTYCAFYF